MTVHIDRAHHHPQVSKELGSWQVTCPRCGRRPIFTGGRTTNCWTLAVIVALYHAKEAFS